MLKIRHNNSTHVFPDGGLPYEKKTEIHQF